MSNYKDLYVDSRASLIVDHYGHNHAHVLIERSGEGNEYDKPTWPSISSAKESLKGMLEALEELT